MFALQHQQVYVTHQYGYWLTHPDLEEATLFPTLGKAQVALAAYERFNYENTRGIGGVRIVEVSLNVVGQY